MSHGLVALWSRLTLQGVCLAAWVMFLGYIADNILRKSLCILHYQEWATDQYLDG